MQRSASFSVGPSDHHPRPSRIPAPVASMQPASAATTPTLLRRTGSMRLPTRSPTEPQGPSFPSPSMMRRTGSLRLPVSNRNSPTVDREVWGVGSGSWGKRQQQRRTHGERPPGSKSSGLGATSPLSNRGSNTSIDKLNVGSYYRRPFEDDDDLCSELSYDSTMSVDRMSSSRRYVVHCSGDHKSQQNGTPYLTPTQRTTLLNKELKAKLKQALDDCSMRDMEISRLTQECVELRMKHARLSSSPDRISVTPPGIEKDSLNSSIHSELPLESVSVSIISEDEPRLKMTAPNFVDEPRIKVTAPSLDEPDEIFCKKFLEEVSRKAPISPVEEIPYPQLEEPQVQPINKLDNHISHVKPQDHFASPVESPSAQRIIAAEVNGKPVAFPVEQAQMRPSYQTKNESRPARPDILNLSFNEDGRGQQPDNCLFNSLPYVIQVPVWQEEKKEKIAEESIFVIKPVEEVKKEDCTIEIIPVENSATQTEADDLEVQLKAAQEALIETKVQLSRLRSAAENSQAEVTLKFLKAAFYHLVTDCSLGMTVATKSHWKAIQSILGFSQEECQAMDSAVATGTFPGSTW